MPAKRVPAGGHGEDLPAASNETKVGRAVNRRMVVTPNLKVPLGGVNCDRGSIHSSAVSGAGGCTRRYLSMTVIHPGLFAVITRYPDHKQSASVLFKNSENFRTLCHDYQDCVRALRYWSRFADTDASNRRSDYEALLLELEEEIVCYLDQTAL